MHDNRPKKAGVNGENDTRSEGRIGDTGDDRRDLRNEKLSNNRGDQRYYDRNDTRMDSRNFEELRDSDMDIDRRNENMGENRNGGIADVRIDNRSNRWDYDRSYRTGNREIEGKGRVRSRSRDDRQHCDDRRGDSRGNRNRDEYRGSDTWNHRYDDRNWERNSTSKWNDKHDERNSSKYTGGWGDNFNSTKDYSYNDKDYSSSSLSNSNHRRENNAWDGSDKGYPRDRDYRGKERYNSNHLRDDGYNRYNEKEYDTRGRDIRSAERSREDVGLGGGGSYSRSIPPAASFAHHRSSSPLVRSQTAPHSVSESPPQSS
jgi:hypothetical protein